MQIYGIRYFGYGCIQTVDSETYHTALVVCGVGAHFALSGMRCSGMETLGARSVAVHAA